MCCLFGSETLNELRDSFFKAEMKLFGAASPRISPLPEIRDVGNLATKVGLNNCVVDRDIIKVSYERILDLFLDIKEMGETNTILERRKSLTTKNLIREVEKFYFKNFTDKKLKSTTHRVIQDEIAESKARYSIPFFLHPAPSINLKSIFREDDEGILADDFLDQRLKEIKLYSLFFYYTSWSVYTYPRILNIFTKNIISIRDLISCSDSHSNFGKHVSLSEFLQ